MIHQNQNHILYDYGGLFYATSIIGGIAMGLFIIGLFMSIFSDDREAIWEFDECFSTAIRSFLVCDIEDGKFHYTIFGRLIDITDKKVNDPFYTYNISRLDKILSLPKYKTRSKSREDKLDKLGVK